MKKIFGIWMILSFVLMAANSFAQENRPIKENMSVEDRAQKRTNHLKEKLSLSDTQIQSVYQLVMKQEMQKEKERANRKDRAAKMDMSMQNILDDEQMVKYNKMNSERKKDMAKKGKMMRSKTTHGKCCEAK